MNFPYSFGFKRYHTQDYYLKTKYGKKVFKVPVDAGFTCPNRDGTKGVGGCVYCSERGSGDFAGDKAKSITSQFYEVREKLYEKWPEADAILYFQPYTNTYGTVAHVQALLEEGASLDGVVGISIATRPDCISREMAEMLGEFSKRIPIEVELGLQSIHPQTAEAINRCHSLAEFQEGYVRLKQQGIRLCVHLINGLPGETSEMMLQTARYVAALKPDSVKFHMLHLTHNTLLGEQYKLQPFPLMEREDYVNLVCDQLELLPPETVVERVTGDAVGEALIAPLWTRKKLVVINNIDKTLRTRNSQQGINYRSQPAIWELHKE